jgi:hypothetical protein
MSRKITKKYLFYVEGETEKMYLLHLQNLINQCKESEYKVKFKSENKKFTTQIAKSTNILANTIVYNIFDYESAADNHIKQFKDRLDEFQKISKLRRISCKIGYSNFTFELWMILHKIDYGSPLQHRDQYVTPINKAYNKNFKCIDDYKKEKVFLKILSSITFNDIKDAVKRAKKIREKNKEIHGNHSEYKGFIYYKDNPDLTIHECVETILKDCGISTD